MEEFGLFFLEILISIGMSLTVIVLLRSYLYDVLAEICGAEKRGAFWVMFTQIMLVISPLLIVILFTQTGSNPDLHPIQAIKDALFRGLFGIFIAMLMVGQVIWRYVEAPRTSGLPMGTTGKV